MSLPLPQANVPWPVWSLSQLAQALWNGGQTHKRIQDLRKESAVQSLSLSDRKQGSSSNKANWIICWGGAGGGNRPRNPSEHVKVLLTVQGNVCCIVSPRIIIYILRWVMTVVVTLSCCAEVEQKCLIAQHNIDTNSFVLSLEPVRWVRHLLVCLKITSFVIWGFSHYFPFGCPSLGLRIKERGEATKLECKTHKLMMLMFCSSLGTHIYYLLL